MKMSTSYIVAGVIGLLSVSVLFLSFMPSGGQTLEAKFEISAGTPARLTVLNGHWKTSTVLSLSGTPALSLNPEEVTATVQVDALCENQERVTKTIDVSLARNSKAVFAVEMYKNIPVGTYCSITAKITESNAYSFTATPISATTVSA